LRNFNLKIFFKVAKLVFYPENSFKNTPVKKQGGRYENYYCATLAKHDKKPQNTSLIPDGPWIETETGILNKL
jgi:hypothetical protein